MSLSRWSAGPFLHPEQTSRRCRKKSIKAFLPFDPLVSSFCCFASFFSTCAAFLFCCLFSGSSHPLVATRVSGWAPPRVLGTSGDGDGRPGAEVSVRARLQLRKPPVEHQMSPPSSSSLWTEPPPSTPAFLCPVPTNWTDGLSHLCLCLLKQLRVPHWFLLGEAWPASSTCGTRSLLPGSGAAPQGLQLGESSHAFELFDLSPTHLLGFVAFIGLFFFYLDFRNKRL